MKVYINHEAFELIEKRITITPAELAKAIGVKESSAAAWLSKWAGKGYLLHIPGLPSEREHRRGPGRPRGSGGCYRIGRKWWGELVFESESLGG